MVSSYEHDGTDYLQVNNSAMTYTLINAVQEHQTIIEIQEMQFQELLKEKEMTAKRI
jgi:hypothetical protein